MCYNNCQFEKYNPYTCNCTCTAPNGCVEDLEYCKNCQGELDPNQEDDSYEFCSAICEQEYKEVL